MSVVGARPQLVKVAPVSRVLRTRHTEVLVHTGQHYDVRMSQVFFEELGIPDPDVNLEVGSGPHGAQTGRILERLERVMVQESPDAVLVFGDTNSTLAAALCAVKLGIPVAHVEAGLRSFDRSMPEEHNRIVTDQLADLLLTPSADADRNLAREGIPKDRVRLVGNIMIDTLVRMLPLARKRTIAADLGLLRTGRGKGAGATVPYALVTLHRPSNVDDPATLSGIMDALGEIATSGPVVFPVHPRTRGTLEKHGIGGGAAQSAKGVRLVEPLGYLDFMSLMDKAAVVLTDSGGIQEETTFLGVPCLTLRENTERPITVSVGTNVVVGRDSRRIVGLGRRAMNGEWKKSRVPRLWDGRTAERIVRELERRF
jgi:UDP-N-acetylglucosamine 2-epimerase (non-hydrolysing)